MNYCLNDEFSNANKRPITSPSPDVLMTLDAGTLFENGNCNLKRCCVMTLAIKLNSFRQRKTTRPKWEENGIVISSVTLSPHHSLFLSLLLLFCRFFSPTNKVHWHERAKYLNLLSEAFISPEHSCCAQGRAATATPPNQHSGRNKMDIKDGLNCSEECSCWRLMETSPHNRGGGGASLSQPSRPSWQPQQRGAEMCTLAQLTAHS